ncbi:MAG: terminase small subunit [Promethearchaeota archaeon]
MFKKDKTSKYDDLVKNVGRPPTFDSPEDMAEKGMEYFKLCEERKEKITVTGLVYHLGFCDKKSLRDYKEKKEYSPLIKKMLLLVENAYEQQLQRGNAAGSIFALKNMGWTDKMELLNKNIDMGQIQLTPEQVKSISKDLDDEY